MVKGESLHSSGSCRESQTLNYLSSPPLLKLLWCQGGDRAAVTPHPGPYHAMSFTETERPGFTPTTKGVPSTRGKGFDKVISYSQKSPLGDSGRTSPRARELKQGMSHTRFGAVSHTCPVAPERHPHTWKPTQK